MILRHRAINLHRDRSYASTLVFIRLVRQRFNMAGRYAIG